MPSHVSGKFLSWLTPSCVSSPQMASPDNFLPLFFFSVTKYPFSGPITSWEIDGSTMSDFVFLGSKITADGDCSHEIKRHLLFGRKAMTNLDGVLKNNDIILLTKVHRVKARVFPVVVQM